MGTDIREIAYTTLSLALELAGAERRARRRGDRLPLLARLGSGIGMRVAEMQRASGLSHEGVRQMLRRNGTGSAPTKEDAVIAVAAIGAVTLESIAGAFGCDSASARKALDAACDAGLLAVGAIGATVPDTGVWLLTPAGEEWLHEYERDLSGRLERDDAHVFYFALTEQERPAIQKAAAGMLSREGHALLNADVCSAMNGPELAIRLHADGTREAFEAMHGIWFELVEDSGIKARFARIADYQPPLASAKV